MTGFVVSNPSGSGATVLVHINGMHTYSKYTPVAAGVTQVFRWSKDRITHVDLRAASGTAAGVLWGVVEKE